MSYSMTPAGRPKKKSRSYAFLAKRGWRDEASGDLRAAKERYGDRDDIQTWVDLDDAHEEKTQAVADAYP